MKVIRDVDAPTRRLAGRLTGDREALASYLQAIEPFARDEGSASWLGLKDAVGDVEEGRAPAVLLVDALEGWLRELEVTQVGFARAPAAAFLTETKRLFDESLETYVRAVRTLLGAARARGRRRLAMADEAWALIETADDLYRRARAKLAQHRRRLGCDR